MNHTQPLENPPIEEDEIDLAEYFYALLEAKWLILSAAFLATMLAGFYAFLATPIYQVDALLQVEEKQASFGTEDLMGMMGQGGASSSTEIEILRSRSVIGKVVDDLGLELFAKPVAFPVVGNYFLRSYADEGVRSAVLGMSSYAWGGQRIRLDRLDVSAALQGASFFMVLADGGKYQLMLDDTLVLEGMVGKLATSEQGDIRVFVSEMIGAVGDRFSVARIRKSDAIAGVLGKLGVSEKGKGTGIITLTYSDADPQLAKDIVDNIAQVYLRQNVERKSEEAQRSLAFLQEQLPQVRAQLEVAEEHMNAYRLQTGSVNMTLETQALLTKVVSFDQQLSELEMKRTDLIQRFTNNHPLIQALDEKSARLQEDKRSLEEKVKALPVTEQKLLTLMRSVKVNTELYTFLLNKSQELKVVEAGTVGNVRILDLAELPYQPIKPKKGMIIMLGLFLGLFLGIVVAFVRKAMHQGVEDPDLVEKNFGISVFSSIPHSELQMKLHDKMRLHKGKQGNALLAVEDNTDLAIESLRSLRTNLHFALMESKSNIVMLTGPAPGLGKSFVSANLGAVLASSGKKVIVVDADMRKGHLHEYFSMPRNPGLSGLIAGNVALDEAIHATGVENLSILPAGVVPPNPADLLMHENFDDILAALSKQFDLVLIDTPPVLAVTDAVLVGKRAGVSFMLLRSGRHPMREIEHAVKRLQHADIRISGFIFNGVLPKQFGYGYGYGGYHYQYEYK